MKDEIMKKTITSIIDLDDIKILDLVRELFYNLYMELDSNKSDEIENRLNYIEEKLEI